MCFGEGEYCPESQSVQCVRVHVVPFSSSTRTSHCLCSRRQRPLTLMRRAAHAVARHTLQLQQNRCIHSKHHKVAEDVQNETVRITTLQNKVRVATEATPGHFSGVGLFVDAGSRYETPSASGVSHFLDRLAFKVSPQVVYAVIINTHRFPIIAPSDHSHAVRPRNGGRDS